MIVVDTSALIDSLTGSRRSAPALRAWIAEGQRLFLPTLVLYEWFRGPRLEEELQAQEALFPPESWIAFGAEEARLAGQLYQELTRPRGREVDLAIAACAIARESAIWTLNTEDFRDVPRVRLAEPV